MFLRSYFRNKQEKMERFSRCAADEKHSGTHVTDCSFTVPLRGGHHTLTVIKSCCASGDKSPTFECCCCRVGVSQSFEELGTDAVQQPCWSFGFYRPAGGAEQAERGKALKTCACERPREENKICVREKPPLELYVCSIRSYTEKSERKEKTSPAAQQYIMRRKILVWLGPHCAFFACRMI